MTMIVHVHLEHMNNEFFDMIEKFIDMIEKFIDMIEQFIVIRVVAHIWLAILSTVGTSLVGTSPQGLG